MANTIIVKKGAGIPAPDQLKEAELALDIVDGSLYTKLNDGTVHHLNDGLDDINLSDYVLEAPDDGKQYVRESKDWSELVLPEGGTGSSVHIGENPPADPEEGQQWMEVPADGDATMWIYDGDKWLQQPGGKDGKDGADGKDGVDGLWTDNGDTSISYNAGNVGIGTDTPLYPSTGRTALTVNGDTSANLVFGHSKAPAHYLLSDASGLTIGDDSGANLTINADGDVAFQNGQISQASPTGQAYFIQSNSGGCAVYSGANGGNQGLFGTSTDHSIAFMTGNTKRLTMDTNGRVDITGSLYVNGTPKIGTVDLIKAFSKLRDAVKDEETVESLKESITNCIGGLIEEWEAMQSPATQEIPNE